MAGGNPTLIFSKQPCPLCILPLMVPCERPELNKHGASPFFSLPLVRVLAVPSSLSAFFQNSKCILYVASFPVIRSSLLPLSIQQSKSSEYMKALKPYMAEIKQKFKGNDDAINRATGKLIEDAKQNPLSGCLLSLVQIPVFLGLYRGVRLLAMDNQLNEPFLWIPSLEGPVSPPSYSGLDWILKGWTASSDGGFPFEPQMGWETTLAFLIMPVVLVVLQSTTMKILQPPVDENMTDDEKKQMETTQTVFKFLPLLIGFFSLQVPAGLTIYWFTSNIFTLTQTLGVRAYFAANPPKIELPDYWESALGDGDNMTPEERRKISEAGIRVGPTFEDLIDESKFHSLITRAPIRSESRAWQRAVSSGAENELPADLRTWVQSGSPSVESGTVHHNEPSSASGAQVMTASVTAEATS
jgi:YidC/Oxa1 family membrane protein insertase